ncbi:MAG TPA: ion channel [Stellaceae bacterium]|nr:ion channel [Stellaceae bacterium]
MTRRRRPGTRRIQAPPERSLLRRLLEPTDLYYRFLTIPWSVFFGLMTVSYLVFNLFFAALYRLQDDSIAESHNTFANAFFFSVQTMATIGYGEMRPVTTYANILVSVEVLLGLLGFALGTGLIFARFSRPTARILFSRVAVVTRYDGQLTLMLRTANQRTNRILDAHVSLTLARDVVTAEGRDVRRLYSLRVERTHSPMFSLSWTVLHTIDETSPLLGATQQDLVDNGDELIVTIVGLDETLSQTVHGRHVYRAHDILFGRDFRDILSETEDGTQVVDYRVFNETFDTESEAE